MSTAIYTLTFAGSTYPIECFSGNDFMERRLKLWRPYEHRELNDLLSLFRAAGARGTVLDVGANIGNHSLAFARMGFERLVAYEMIAETRELLERNLTRACPVPFEIVEAAVSDVSRNCLSGYALKVYHKNHGSTALRVEVGAALNIRTVTLDSYTGPEVDFVKVDVEGHEANVLRGGQAFFEAHRPVLMIEVWRRHRATVFTQLADMGYHDGLRMRGEFGDNFLFVHERGRLPSAALATFPRRRAQ